MDVHTTNYTLRAFTLQTQTPLFELQIRPGFEELKKYLTNLDQIQGGSHFVATDVSNDREYVPTGVPPALTGLRRSAFSIDTALQARRLHLSPAHHAGAGNHQNIIDVLFLQERTQFPDFARAFQIGGHTVTHEIIAHFQNRLKGSAP